MPEPATTSVTAASVSATVLFVSILGPQAGPWALIVAASIGGGLFPLSGSETQSTRKAIMLLLRCALLDLTEITETLGEPNFAPEKILLHCEHLLTLLQGARLVLAGREPTHV